MIGGEKRCSIYVKLTGVDFNNRANVFDFLGGRYNNEKISKNIIVLCDDCGTADYADSQGGRYGVAHDRTAAECEQL